MKHLLIILFLFSFNSFAEDCEKVIQEMEAFKSKIQTTLSSVSSAEQESLYKILNKQVKGPNVLKIAKENEDKLYKVILPSRKITDDAITSGLSNFISQLKNCKMKTSECSESVKNNSRNTIKDLRETADQIDGQINSKAVSK